MARGRVVLLVLSAVAPRCACGVVVCVIGLVWFSLRTSSLLLHVEKPVAARMPVVFGALSRRAIYPSWSGTGGVA